MTIEPGQRIEEHQRITPAALPRWVEGKPKRRRARTPSAAYVLMFHPVYLPPDFISGEYTRRPRFTLR